MTDHGRRIRHTKIVCTVGPASSDAVVLREMILAGMNVARVNFSHGSHDEHASTIRIIRELAGELNRYIAIMADLQGPKIRVGTLPKPRMLRGGDTVWVLTRNLPAPQDLAADELPVKLEFLSSVVQPGSSIMLADGMIRLCVEEIEPNSGRILCRIQDDGEISSNKGVNLPDLELDIPSLTTKDRTDLQFALQQGVDYVALSFVQRPDDVLQLRELITQHPSDEKPQIVSKIERRLAVERLDDILAVSDAVMVARGDLGVELGAADVPLVQKRIIKRANELAMPVITATQMLESMTYHPEPTRAEASDVANAILDGTSALMLSGETAMGAFPVVTIRVMDRIARVIEPAIDKPLTYFTHRHDPTVPQALSEGACEIGELLNAGMIIVLTETGRTARQVSRNKPRRPVLASSRSLRTCRRLALDWGTVPVLINPDAETEDAWTEAITYARRYELVGPGDRVVFTAGTISNKPGMTNMLKVEQLDVD